MPFSSFVWHAHWLIAPPPNPADLLVNGKNNADDRISTTTILYYHFNDVWAYYIDTNTWEEIFPTGPLPPPMRNHTAAYDPINQRMVVSGGYSYWHVNTYIWTLSLVRGWETWDINAPTTGIFPGNFSDDEIFYSPSLKSIVGYKSSSTYMNSLFVWNMETGISREVSFSYRPSKRIYSAMVLDDARHRLLLYGGGEEYENSSIYNELWELNLTPGTEYWTLLPRLGNAPPAKWLLRPVIDPDRNCAIYYGGNSCPHFEDGDYSDSTYEFDLNSNTWNLAKTITPPSARGQYGSIWDPVTRQMFIFGGLYRVGPSMENVITYNEIWVYNSDTRSWFQQLPVGPKPRVRRRPTTVFDEANRRIIVFGGEAICPIVSQVQAAIKVPRNGRKIGGNRVTVMAEIVSGSIDKVREVLFQYRQPSITGEWKNITPAGDNHSNPDTDSPFFIHWDVTDLPEGQVNLRAVATDLWDAPDSAPDEITVIIDNKHPDTDETLTTDSHVRIEYETDQSALHDISVSDDYIGSHPNTVNANVRIRIPGSMIEEGVLLSATFQDLKDHPEWKPEGGAVGFVSVIHLDSQTSNRTLKSGEKSEIIIAYPDKDQDGIVDNTSIQENMLTIYSPDGDGGIEMLSGISVDPETNTVRGETSRLSYFIIGAKPIISPKLGFFLY